jgi:hypothetical protein
MKKFLLIALLLVACDTRRNSDWGDQSSDYVPTFQPITAPQCPAPGTDQAVSYQQSVQQNGTGHDSALAWWLLAHTIANSGPAYHETVHEVHHYHEAPPATRQAPQQYPRMQGVTFNAPRRVTTAPAKTTSGAVILRTAPTKPSASFGYKAAATRPASTSFRASTRK